MLPNHRAKRNRAIDVLRGFAIVLMIANHVGAASRITTVLNLPVWFDPAGPFVLLSGLVLGLGLRSDKPVTGVLRRARQLWVIQTIGMVIVLAVHEATGRLNSPSVAGAGGLVATAWKLPLLRLQAHDYMNILPLFIVFFLAAPLLVRAMRGGWTIAVVAGSCVLWLVTQRWPEWLRFTDPACGPEAFVLPAWQFAFVSGLAFGLHADEIAAWFARSRRWLVPVSIAFVGSLFVVAQLQRRTAGRLHVTLPAWASWSLSKETWAPTRALYTVCILGLAYLAIDGWLRKGSDGALKHLELLGRRSLYSFLVHLPLALLASGLLLYEHPGLVQDAAAVAAIVAVYLMARYEVLARYIPN